MVVDRDQTYEQHWVLSNPAQADFVIRGSQDKFCDCLRLHVAAASGPGRCHQPLGSVHRPLLAWSTINGAWAAYGHPHPPGGTPQAHSCLRA